MNLERVQLDTYLCICIVLFLLLVTISSWVWKVTVANQKQVAAPVEVTNYETVFATLGFMTTIIAP